MHSVLAHWRQFALFLAGGVLCALADIGMMKTLLAAGAHFTVAATAGFATGLLVNYGFHSRVTFGAAATANNFARYMCVVGINYLLTMLFVSASAHLLGDPVLGKIVSLPVVAVNGYVLGKFWIFR
jgi:putative flippase GtrA